MEFLRRLGTIFLRYAPGVGRTLQPIGLLLLLMAAGFAAAAWNTARPLLRATGVVTENVSNFAPQGGVIYAPKVRFRLADGVLVQFIQGPGREDAEFSPGDILPVLYPAGRPEAAAIATAWHWYGTAIWLAIWGVAVFDVGLVIKRLGVGWATA